MQSVIFFLICMSLFFTFLGGLTDIIVNVKKKKRNENNQNNQNNENNQNDENHTFFVSKEHLWNDGVYLLLLASFLQIYLINKK